MPSTSRRASTSRCRAGSLFVGGPDRSLLVREHRRALGLDVGVGALAVEVAAAVVRQVGHRLGPPAALDHVVARVPGRGEQVGAEVDLLAFELRQPAEDLEESFLGRILGVTRCRRGCAGSSCRCAFHRSRRERRRRGRPRPRSGLARARLLPGDVGRGSLPFNFCLRDPGVTMPSVFLSQAPPAVSFDRLAHGAPVAGSVPDLRYGRRLPRRGAPADQAPGRLAQLELHRLRLARRRP